MKNIKTIGIILRSFQENNKKFIGTREDLFKALYKYDVNVIGIPINIDINKIINLVNVCDGIILSGGDSFIENDFRLVKYLYKNNIPTLGICLGMQSMGRVFSDTFEINVKNHNLENNYGHYIKIIKNSLLYKIMDCEKIFVNSRHNSALQNTTLFISSKSEDNVIEAIEDFNKKFFLGVEWHPESLDSNYSDRLFEYFISCL